jgi:hypothetical protein
MPPAPHTGLTVGWQKIILCGATQSQSKGGTMKRLLAVTATLLLIAFAAFGCAHYEDSGWVTLINGGKGLENFNRMGDANWRADYGSYIVADSGKGGHLVSKKSYKDFVMRAEFWADDTTNSGIFIRISDPKKIGSATAYEVNIYDHRPDPRYGTGAIVNVAMVNPMPKAGGKWNTYEITAQGPELTVVFNGVVTAYARDSKFKEGPISLRYGSGANNTRGGTIRWRKVQIKEL